MIMPSCAPGLGSDRGEDEAAARGEGVPGQHRQPSHPAEAHALLRARPSTARRAGVHSGSQFNVDSLASKGKEITYGGVH